MSKDTRIEFINQQSNYLPDRKKGKRGPDPIRKEVILEELFKLFRTNCGWRNNNHSSTCFSVGFYGELTSLPNAYVASESAMKLRATDFAFRSVGKKLNLKGYKTDSKVSDQPIGFAETYEGAKNRLEDLKQQVTGEYEYLVPIESGNIHFTNDCGLFNFSVCIIEDKKNRKN